MTDFSEEQRKKLEEYLATHHLPKGIGNREEACSIAAINLVLTGELKDSIPECMSFVIGRWIIRIQDALPDNMRNSQEWKSLLPLAAGTGRDHEQERRQIVISWLWEMVMPYFQPYADRIDMGDEWRNLIEQRDYSTALSVKEKAWAKRKAFWDAVADAVADAAAAAAAAVAAAAVDAAVADAAADAAVAAVDAVDAAAADAAVAARRKFFVSVDIYAVLRKLIEVSQPTNKEKND